MKHILITLLVALAMAAIGYGIGQRQAAPPAMPEALTQMAKQAYVCPMHAHIVFDHPGTCPICGMDLVAAGAATDAAASQIHVDTATLAKLGVRLASAEETEMTQDIVSHATLVPDESAVLRITPNVEGVLTRLHVHRIGQRIAPGQVLYEISSHDALAVQYEYIDNLRRGAPARKMADDRRAQNRQLLEEAGQEAGAREQAERSVRQSEEQLASILQPLQRDHERATLRLRQMGFTESMLATLAASGKALASIPARASRGCVVKEILARPGMQVGAMTEILSCVETTHAALELALYPDQLAWVREGDAMTIAFEDGTTLKTRLSGLNPMTDNATRTVRARVPVALGRAPVLGEYATVTVHAAPRRVLSVPRSAVMRTGRGNFVMRALGNGHFMPVQVTTGIESSDRIAIREGLEAGDQVAVNGQFLLDAAASIAESAQRMQTGHSD